MKFHANIKSDVNFEPAAKKVLGSVDQITHAEAKAWMQASKAACPVGKITRSGAARLIYKIGGKRLTSEYGTRLGQYWRRGGTLRKSIRLVKGKQRNVISWQIHAGERISSNSIRAGEVHAYYASMVELGTRYLEPAKYLRKFKQRSKRQWYNRLRNAMFDMRAA